MLETLYYLTDSSTLPNAAQYMLQADTLLNGGQNVLLLCKHFSSKKILSPCQEDTVVADTTNFFYVANSIGFSQGIAPVTINTGNTETANLQLFDMNGRRLLNQKIENGTVSIDPQPFASGVYIVRITGSAASYTIKLNRF